MIERKKVMRGLEAHSRPICETCDGQECPYYRINKVHDVFSCSVFLASDALSLLKEQEARVMTLEEARRALHESDILRCEDKGNSSIIAMFLNYDDYWDFADGQDMNIYDLDEGGYYENEYGKTFRFWTSRPTPEQMRETKWEGEKA